MSEPICPKCNSSSARISESYYGEVCYRNESCSRCGHEKFIEIWNKGALKRKDIARLKTMPPVWHRLSVLSATSLFGGQLFRHGTSCEYPDCSYSIYLLFRNDCMVYIGQSVNAESRIRQHQSQIRNYWESKLRTKWWKSHESAIVLRSDDKEEMDAVERIMIWLFRPIDNVRVDRPTIDKCHCARSWFAARGINISPLMKVLREQAEELAEVA